MGKIELDHTGSGSGITLSSDGTDLLLNGTAVGGAALELYAESTATFTAPTANTGGAYNSVAIGNGADIGFGRGESIAIGTNSFCNQSQAIALGHGATTSGFAGVTLGRNATATNNYATAIGPSYASGTDSLAAAIASNSSSYGATGANSIAIGKTVKATSGEAIAMGASSIASSNNAIAIGNTNTASGTSGATTVGGYSNTASGSKSFIFGAVSTASADNTMVLGERGVADTIGKLSRASGGFAAVAGTAQSGTFVLRSDTTDATAEALTTNLSTASTNNQVNVSTNAAYAFHGTIIAKQSGSANAAAWKVEGLIVNNGGTTTLTNSATTVISNTPSWGMALSADDTNDALAITVTGAAATNIRWVATIHTSEVTYA